MRSFRTVPPASSAQPNRSHENGRHMYRTHKIALDPTDRQLTLLKRQADYARAAYNWALRCYNDGEKAGHEPTIEALKRQWNAVRTWKYAWGKDLSQEAAQYAIEALGYGLRAWKNRSQKNTRPRFHSRSRNTAFRIVNTTNRVRCEGHRIGLLLPTIGAVRMHQELRFREGRIVRVTVKREAGRWYACVTVECPRPQTRRDGCIVGVDVGIRNLAVSSDGKTYSHFPGKKDKRRQRHQERKVERYEETAARQVRGSARRQCTLDKLERARHRIRWRRDDVQRKTAADIVSNKRLVVAETLDVRGMREDREGMALLITRAGMHGMQQKLALRCEASGAEFLKARPDFPSTQLCSRCGGRQKMPVDRKDDTYSCPCGALLGRDFNAALNLRAYGQRVLARRQAD